MSTRASEAFASGGPLDDLVVEPSDVHAKVPGRADVSRELSLDSGQIPIPPVANARYELRRLLGEGGWATVWEAHDRELERSVALKFLRDACAEHLLRFRREARIAAAVRHENLHAIYDVAESDDGRPILVTELLTGEDLDHRLRRRELSLEEVVGIARQVLRALDALSKAGIVHRDVKPHNIFLHRNEDGTEVVKLMDFGIAIALEDSSMQAALKQRVTTTGMLVGTPHYMSPEHLMGKEPDVRSDLYSLGVALYEAVTGRAPHDDDATAVLIAAILRDPVQPVRALRPGVPIELERVLMKALARDPDDRYASSAEMLEALEAVDLTNVEPLGPLTGSRRKPTLSGLGPHEASIEAATDASGRVPPVVVPGRAPRRGIATAQLAATLAAGALVALSAMSTDRDPRGTTKTHRVEAAAIATPPRTVASEPDVGPSAPERVTTPPSPSPAAASSAVLPDVRPNGQAARDAFRAYARGDMVRAYGLYERATRESPSNARAWLGLGMTARATGNRTAANRAFRRYLALRPNAPDARSVRAMIRQ